MFYDTNVGYGAKLRRKVNNMHVQQSARLYQWSRPHKRLTDVYAAIMAILIGVGALCGVLILNGRFTGGLEFSALAMWRTVAD